ncbi:hypothetical protein DPMN_094596 [Dreissena polymorpha]|uniref:Uncharacterized protein n=1 Tax=Dreissena polymorpha TaxID=45954 RepID=A0A9D4L6C0_DREPO|nr:hypothetical protein DPMN_094596 [Dreissena polymorpha]
MPATSVAVRAVVMTNTVLTESMAAGLVGSNGRAGLVGNHGRAGLLGNHGRAVQPNVMLPHRTSTDPIPFAYGKACKGNTEAFAVCVNGPC